MLEFVRTKRVRGEVKTIEPRCGGRRGTSLVELIGVMIVLGILAVIAFGAVSVAVNNSKATTAEKALASYKSAFMQACSTHPGIIEDRFTAWEAGSGSYTSKDGLKKVVNYMNEVLDNDFVLTWNSTLLCYESQGEDPWGGKYILTEYPVTSTENYYDPTTFDTRSMEISIWATGKSDQLLIDHVVGEDDFGVALRYNSGLITEKYHGSENLGSDGSLLGGEVTFG